MRILYLDICHRYLGPAQALNPALLAVQGDVTFFGPGYVDSETLAKGVDAFIEKKEPFDLVVASDILTVFNRNTLEIIKKYTKKYWSYSFPTDDFYRCVDVRTWFKNYSGFKIGLLFAFDAYVIKDEDIKWITESGCYIATVLGKTFVKSVDEIENITAENFSNMSNNWYNFLNSYPERIIELPFFMAANEFSFNRLNVRRTPWAIAGVPYADRKVARQELRKNGIKVSGLGLARTWHILLKLGFPIMSTDLGISFMHSFFVNQLSNARYCFTDGSRLAYPVRKFFEIPAKGAVLVCNPCQGFEALGFVNGKNAIACKPEDVVDVHNDLEKNIEKAQEIADAGLKLILEKHSLFARAMQFKKAIGAIKQGTFAGSYWQNGELIL